MNRRQFVKSTIGLSLASGLSLLHNQVSANVTQKMPALFIGHGDPTNVIQKNSFSNDWDLIGQNLPKPKAILMVSAHWETPDIAVAVTNKPPMIYDFGGFPDIMYQLNYPAPGSPEFAKASAELLNSADNILKVREDEKQGLDHGAWCVLARLFPKADVPVFQFSLSRSMSPLQHYQLAQQLKPLREKGVMIIGSGNITHNMRSWQRDHSLGQTHLVHDWAKSFDEKVVKLIEKGDHKTLVNYHLLGRDAEMAIPTPEHYLPLLYTLAVRDENEQAKYFSEGFEEGSFSMRSLLFKNS